MEIRYKKTPNIQARADGMASARYPDREPGSQSRYAENCSQ
jgi:hypothetical protein